MGLDTTHNAWHGPYSSFGRWRKWLAKQIGFNLEEMQGYGGDRPFDEMDHDIKPLLNHSDCDGELSPEECKQIANGLKQIIDKVSNQSTDLIESRHIEVTIQFREGCLLAYSQNETIEFH